MVVVKCGLGYSLTRQIQRFLKDVTFSIPAPDAALL